MFVVLMISWWYTSGWLTALQKYWHVLRSFGQSFSIGTILLTLFSPWKRITSLHADEPLLSKIADNLISRFVGALVRLSVLAFALPIALAYAVLGAAFVLVWPLLPPLSLVLLWQGVAG